MIDKLETMLVQGQDSALLRYSLGNEYLKADDYDQAVGHLQKALDHDPNYSAAWKILGKALTAKGDHDGAVKAYEKGIKVAEEKGDIQAAKEMKVFLKRLKK